jgi:hypothetical protein
MCVKRKNTNNDVQECVDPSLFVDKRLLQQRVGKRSDDFMILGGNVAFHSTEVMFPYFIS